MIWSIDCIPLKLCLIGRSIYYDNFRKVGLWIDHRKAIMVATIEQGEKIEEIVSGVEKQLQRAGDSPGERLRQRPLEGDDEVVQVPADDCSRIY